MKNRLRFHRGKRVAAAALIVLLLCALLPGTAEAAGAEGLVVERISFRDVLRLYTVNKANFGVDAMQTDASGVTNAAKRLAELFTYTVGLNYTGEGLSANYFGKDVTSAMGTEPYTERNLLATYDVEISPYRSYAVALPQGSTTAIRVYLTGYTNAANGVEPLLHYVWEENGSWYAVKDDSRFYKVSYNGYGAWHYLGYSTVVTYTHATAAGTETLQAWQSLTDTVDGGGVVHCADCTLVAGQGTACIFGVTNNLARLRTEGNYSSSLLAVSDFFQGDTTYQTGPLVYSRECYELSTMRRIADGETLQEGVSYRFRVVYDEGLAVSSGAGWGDVALAIRSEVTGETKYIRDFVWYGDAEFFTSDKYNPHTIEFTFTPSAEGAGVCTITLQNLVGSDSTLKAASFHALTRTSVAAAPAPTAAPTPAVTAEPAPAAPSFTAAPAFTASAMPTAAPATPAPTPAPETVTAIPVFTAAPMVTAAPAAAPAAATLPLMESDPAAPLTRGVLARTLWVLSGQPVPAASAGYVDLPADFAAAQAILWAGGTGLIPAGGDGAFVAERSVTREEMAAILYRYAALRGRDTSVYGDLSVWTDGAAVSANAQTGVLWALSRGLFTVNEYGLIAPRDVIRCGEALSMIALLQQNV